ncbi:hypothetical protein LCGC14_3070530 [marine sediment metagenome]|uniref:DAGKc domain-containing protein n=1 Tax=marine sediment metagenome TaxID=412755 RepID=A0A0F8YNU3_9ZZZZ|nr:hypothetical protein [Spirochaetota bacterium]
MCDSTGGDWSVNEVLNGIMGSDVAIGIIPTGTANDLASYYRLPCNIEKACDIILKRRIHRADLILVNNRYFITAGGLGFSSEVANIVNTIKNQPFLGKNFVISPDAVNDDGIFNVCLIKNSKTRAGKLSILIKVLTGRHIYFPSVKM